MIKKVNDTTIPKYAYVCDICGAELKYSLSYGKARCECCKKDLCESCIGHEEETGEDYRCIWCQRCWDIGAEYRSRIDSLNKAADALKDEWREKCYPHPVTFIMDAKIKK